MMLFRVVQVMAGGRRIVTDPLPFDTVVRISGNMNRDLQTDTYKIEKCGTDEVQILTA